MRRELHTFRGLTDSVSVREEEFMGRKYLAVPVVALVQGVVHSSNATEPELALAAEFAKIPDAWNFRPVVMNHPKDVDGNPVSANSPGVLSNYQFGFMFNTVGKDNSAGKPSLITEAWIDPERCEALGGDAARVLERVNAGEQIEVSTGLYSVSIPEMGTYDGKRYNAVWREVVPDHLAFLSEGTLGACSIADGCGAMRANTAPKVNDTQSAPATAGPQVPTVPEIVEAVIDPTPNTHSPDGGWIRTEKDEASDPEKVSYAGKSTSGVNVSGPTAMASKDTKNDGDADDPNKPKGKMQLKSKRGVKYNSAGFALKASCAGNCQCGGKCKDAPSTDPVVLKARTQAQRDPSTRFSRLLSNSYPDQMVDVDVRNLLQDAISDSYVGYCYLLMFNKDNAIFVCYDLDSWDADTYSVPFNVDENGKVTFTGPATEVALLTRIVPVQDVEVNTAPPDNDDINLSNQEASPMTKTNTSPDPNIAPVVEAPKVLSAAEYIAQAPAEIRSVLEESMRTQKARKDELIKGLKASNRCDYSDDELNGMSIRDLERMSKLAVVPNYAGAGPVRTNAAPEEQRDEYGVARMVDNGKGQLVDNQATVPAPLKLFEAPKASKAA